MSCVSLYQSTDVIEEGIEQGGVACDVGTKSKEQCQNVTVSSFMVEETLSNVRVLCTFRSAIAWTIVDVP